MQEQPEDREILRDEPVDADALAEEEAAAAAAEAASIGGRVPEADLDPAERPLAEAGQGVAEGFEQAEEDLVRHASHADPAVPPTEAAFTPEEESDRSTAVYGEPDELYSTEIAADPLEGEDDPDGGPGGAPGR